MAELPMVPLGSVLLPHGLLPLHVFEERYRVMTRHVLDGGGEFGVTLIERGSEVGGGDVRTTVGTVARVVRAEELPDGRWHLLAVGTPRRLRVLRWLPDDPYPRAEVADWPDTHGGADGGTGAAGAGTTADVTGLLRRVAALRTELGEPAPPLDLELSDDPVTAGYQATLAAPLGPADRQALLCAPSVGERFALLRDLLRDEVTVLEARLSGG
jgi:Lon protease-like protein